MAARDSDGRFVVVARAAALEFASLAVAKQLLLFAARQKHFEARYYSNRLRFAERKPPLDFEALELIFKEG